MKNKFRQAFALSLATGFAALVLTACHANPKDSSQTGDPIADSSDSSSFEELIIGGHNITKKSEIAATTVSLIDTRQGSLCTASLLAEDIAITAAHCVDGDPEDMQLSFGPTAVSKENRPVVAAVTSSVWRQHQNEEFNNGDIAVIKFSGGLPKGTVAATLMKSTHHLSDGEIVTLAGYGISKPGSETDGAGRLRTVDVKIAKAHYSETEVSLDQTRKKGACHGDSGGPAFIQDNGGGLQLWGVTSRGIGDPTDHCAGQSVYTRIQPYTRWINSVVRSWRK
jgi:secreted trypsin-like serine protease